MTISFSCSECFKDYRVRDQFAGKRVKCKACGSPMLVPTGDSAASHDEDFLGTLNAAAGMEARATTVEDYGSSTLPPKAGGTRPASSSAQAAKPRRKKKKRKKRSREPGSTAKIIFLVFLAGVVCLLGVGLVVPGIGLLVALPILAVAVIAQLVGGLWVWGLAFQEDIVCGLLFFLPVYPLYYLVSRWEDELPFWLAGYGLLGNITMQVYLIFLLPGN